MRRRRPVEHTHRGGRRSWRRRRGRRANGRSPGSAASSAARPRRSQAAPASLPPRGGGAFEHLRQRAGLHRSPARGAGATPRLGAPGALRGFLLRPSCRSPRPQSGFCPARRSSAELRRRSDHGPTLAHVLVGPSPSIRSPSVWAAAVWPSRWASEPRRAPRCPSASRSPPRPPGTSFSRRAPCSDPARMRSLPRRAATEPGPERGRVQRDVGDSRGTRLGDDLDALDDFDPAVPAAVRGLSSRSHRDHRAPRSEPRRRIWRCWARVRVTRRMLTRLGTGGRRRGAGVGGRTSAVPERVDRWCPGRIAAGTPALVLIAATILGIGPCSSSAAAQRLMRSLAPRGRISSAGQRPCTFSLASAVSSRLEEERHVDPASEQRHGSRRSSDPPARAQGLSYRIRGARRTPTTWSRSLHLLPRPDHRKRGRGSRASQRRVAVNLGIEALRRPRRRDYRGPWPPSSGARLIGRPTGSMRGRSRARIPRPATILAGA